MNRTRTRLRTMLLWAMLPLTVLGGSPRFLCLCSNGQIKAFCNGATAPRTCCPVSAKKAVRACSQSGCCGSNNTTHGADPSCGTATCRCTRLVALPDVPTKLVVAALPDMEPSHSPVVELQLTISAATRSVVRIENSPPRLAGRDMLTALDRWLV